MFAQSGEKVLASRTIVEELLKDPTDIWVSYKNRGPVTQRQVAHLLDAYDIRPMTVHPPGVAPSDTPRGYKAEQFADAFSRYTSVDPPEHPKPTKIVKTKRTKATAKAKRTKATAKAHKPRRRK
jgi:hypothetical protein